MWDLSSSIFNHQTRSLNLSSFPHMGSVVVSQLQLAAHSGPCRCLAWCPRDQHYLFTSELVVFLVSQYFLEFWIHPYLTLYLCLTCGSGGHDRMMCLWDLREPHEPQEKQEKGNCVHSLHTETRLTSSFPPSLPQL